MTRRLFLPLVSTALSGVLLVGLSPSLHAQPDVRPQTWKEYPQTSLADFTRDLAAPTVVTIHLQNAPLSTVLDEWERQTGVRLRTVQQIFALRRLADVPQADVPQMEAPEEPKVTLDIDRQPYWLALLELSRATKNNSWVPIDNRPGAPAPTVSNLNAQLSTNYLRGPNTQTGPFLFVINSVQRQKSSSLSFATAEDGIAPARPRTLDSLSAQLSVFVDPKLNISKVKPSFVIDEITDNRGQILRPAAGRGRGGASALGFGRDQLKLGTLGQVQVQIPESIQGDAIADLHGIMTLYQPRKVQTWELPDAENAKGTTKTLVVDGQTIQYTLHEMTLNGNQAYVNITFDVLEGETPAPAFNPMTGIQDPLADSRFSGFMQGMRIEDAKGRVFSSGGGGSSSYGGKHGEYKLNVNATSDMENNIVKPLKLVIEVPSDYTAIKVPFEFKDVPLP